jgi:hypothetical protein
VSLAIGLVAASASAEMSVEEYRAGLVRAREAARHALAAPTPDEVRARAIAAQHLLPHTDKVTGADGLSVSVSNRALQKALDRAVGTPSVVARRRSLEAFVRRSSDLSAALAPATAKRSPREGQILRQVLARSEFRPSWLEEWNRRWNEWLRSTLQRLFGDVQPATLDLIAKALYYGVLALLALLIAYLIWNYVPGLRFRRRGRAIHLEDEDLIAVPERAAKHLTAAEAAAVAGRFLEALRHTHTAMLLLLDEARRLEYDPARTNWEVLRLLRSGGHGAEREALLPVTRAIDEKLFGGRPTTEADYQSGREACARLRQMLASGPPEARARAA